jgi:Ca2+-binding EF-hand superfamily protein
LEFTLKFFDHDDDGKISYSDLLVSLLPYKMCKDYRDAVKGINQPPDEVLLHSFIDDNGNPMREIMELWPRRLTTSIEFCLKRFFLAIISLHKTLTEQRCSFRSEIESKSKGQKSKTVNLTVLLLNLIQIQTMGDDLRNVSTTDLHEFNQNISSRAFREYLSKICKDNFYSDTHMIKTITRALDKDMDGHVSILDFVKSLTKGYNEEDSSIQTVTQILNKLKYDDEDLYSKSLQIKYQSLFNSKKSKGARYRLNSKEGVIKGQIDSDESPQQNR